MSGDVGLFWDSEDRILDKGYGSVDSGGKVEVVSVDQTLMVGAGLLVGLVLHGAVYQVAGTVGVPHEVTLKARVAALVWLQGCYLTHSVVGVLAIRNRGRVAAGLRG